MHSLHAADAKIPILRVYIDCTLNSPINAPVHVNE